MKKQAYTTTPVKPNALGLAIRTLALGGLAAGLVNVAHADLLSVNKTATASSEMQAAAYAFDNNQNTRWESAHAVDPTSISVDLGETYDLDSIVVHWEAANAASYTIEGSDNGVNWTQIGTYTGGTFGNRTDTVNVDGNYRHVRLNGTQRSDGNAWGYSIWELEVHGAEVTEPPVVEPPTEPGENLAIYGTATASSGNADVAIDNNAGTRWESDHGIDPSSFTLDLGATYSLNQVVIDWEAANAKVYAIQGSNDGTNFTTLANYSGGEFGTRTDTLNIAGDYRYVRMLGTERSDGNAWGYSIWEFKVYGGGETEPPVTEPPVTEPPVVEPPIFTDLNYQPLFNNTHSPDTAQEWYTKPDGTVVTIASGRARSRHESEDIFYTFPTHYFEHRTFEIEIHDHTPKGQNLVEVFYHPEYANYVPPGCRSSYSNVWRADFNNNAGMDEKLQTATPDGKGERWVCRIQRDAHNGDDGILDVGSWMEFELQQFLGLYEGDPNVCGQAVYYTDTYRFKLGQPGIYIVGDEAMEEKIRAGGRATAPYVKGGDSVPVNEVISVNGDNTLTYKVMANGKWTQKDNPNGTVVTFPIRDGIAVYDNYVVASGVADWTTYFREALNIQWDTHNEFMQGRRVFHTRMDTGVHEEVGNPDFPELANIADGLMVKNSCLGCHVNNGRGIAPQNGALLDTLVVKVGSGAFDNLGQPQPHSYYGGVLQNLSLDAAVPAEGSVRVTYTAQNGTFNDGTGYSLQAPTYSLEMNDTNGGAIQHISPRMPQNITGLGLLEALPENEILAWHDPDDSNGDGISGRANVVTSPETGQQFIGRFGWKASSASLRDFAATALSGDMGVNTSVLPNADCGAQQTACIQNSGQGVELSDLRLNELVVYLQALGAPSRRPETVDQPMVVAGEQRFTDIGCASCHRPEMNTGHKHDLAELRGNVIRPYTDMLLHDMGPGLADSLTQAPELNREWRTAPLWGLGMNLAVNGHDNLLHDGRARSIEEAILWHGGEAQASNNAYKALSAQQRAELIAFLRSL
ncbi:di-heme oxidoredictase family protein [Saccharophagus degradans]|uniref:di-heme oxidoredictase family protein n=1 Tax=Saccharophagus degradans TaxID=86304 RepID=UPI002477EEA1|nr:di-heme oxidoredictase family protein [Saccharophagus degradans]WGO98094.1 di-heme oxidoredictase family protein [Saccharophagus degradans]